MEVSIDREDLQDLQRLMIENGDLFDLMNEKGLSFGAIAFLFQTMINAINEAQREIDEDEN